MSSAQKKQWLRLVIGVVYLVGMIFLYGSVEGVVWWFWTWPLAIAILVYNVILWGKRCPSCREDFALDPGHEGSLSTTYICRFCGAQCQRIGGGPGAGGGGGP